MNLSVHYGWEDFMMKTNGYTLIEVLVVLFLVGILAALAIPSWLSFLQRQRIRSAASQLYWALQLAKSEAAKTSVRYGVTVCSNFSEFRRDDGIKYDVHPYSDSPVRFTTIERVALVKSTVRSSLARYNLSTLEYGDCYTTYLGLFPGDGYGLGDFYVSAGNRQYIYRVGFNTLIGNVVSCSVVSLTRSECR
jgi:prepilin-type N-terminal cleavage/methylation domain-containing protein